MYVCMYVCICHAWPTYLPTYLLKEWMILESDGTLSGLQHLHLDHTTSVCMHVCRHVGRWGEQVDDTHAHTHSLSHYSIILLLPYLPT